MKRLVKASNICDIKVMWCDDDYDVHFKKPYGSFTCKHILAAIKYIMDNESWREKLQEEVFA